MAGDGSPGSEDSQTKREKPKASVLYTSVLPARFALPQDVACDGQDGAVVADTVNQAVRHVASDGITVTLGGGRGRGSRDGLKSEASFAEPAGIAYNARSQDVFVVESGNGKMRKVRISNGDAFSFARDTSTATRTSSLSTGALVVSVLSVVASTVLACR